MGRIRRICTQVEERFPSIVAEFEKLPAPYLGGEHDGCITVELFDVTDGERDDVLRYANQLGIQHLMAGGKGIVFSDWTPEETEEYFGHAFLRDRVGAHTLVFEVSIQPPFGRRLRDMYAQLRDSGWDDELASVPRLGDPFQDVSLLEASQGCAVGESNYAKAA